MSDDRREMARRILERVDPTLLSERVDAVVDGETVSVSALDMAENFVDKFALRVHRVPDDEDAC